MKRLPPELHADALHRLRALAQSRHRYRERDPTERALNLRAWMRSASLDRYGWRVGLDADRRLVALIGRRRIDLEHDDYAHSRRPR